MRVLKSLLQRYLLIVRKKLQILVESLNHSLQFRRKVFVNLKIVVWYLRHDEFNFFLLQQSTNIQYDDHTKHWNKNCKIILIFIGKLGWTTFVCETCVERKQTQSLQKKTPFLEGWRLPIRRDNKLFNWKFPRSLEESSQTFRIDRRRKSFIKKKKKI
jgi:hypothetical protein